MSTTVKAHNYFRNTITIKIIMINSRVVTFYFIKNTCAVG